jgi:hypothetical protein
MKKFTNITVALFLLTQLSISAQVRHESALISKTDSLLEKFVALQQKCADIHPCLTEHQPIAIVYNDSLLIFDFDTEAESYALIKKAGEPFPLPKGIEASFPLSVYDNKPTCIITPTTLERSSSFATILHEFIHCCQFNSVEMQLKGKLEIYKEAMKMKDYSWEIMYPFPYDNPVFINYYNRYKEALESDNLAAAKKLRSEIKEYLDPNDYEYMLWEEWKEGFARYVENKVRDKMGVKLNNYGSDEPYDRVAFYYSGELLISKIAGSDPQLPGDMGRLYEAMEKF